MTPSRFDERNEDTFGNEFSSSGGDTGWSVQDMFAVNSRLTGQTYSYDGNPHNFGNRHPQYVNYTKGVQDPSLTSTSKSLSSSVLQSESTPSDLNRLPRPPFYSHNSNPPHLQQQHQDDDVIKSQSLFSHNSSNPSSTSTSLPSFSETRVTKQYFPSPFVFDTQKVLQTVDQALGIQPQSSGKKGRKLEN